jgi:hypothetical protein
LLILLPFASAAQEAAPDAAPRSIVSSPSIIPPKPSMGWVLDDNEASIPAAFGDTALEAEGTGTSPGVALDGAGNIDGAAIVGGVPTAKPVRSYALKSAAKPTLAAGTTVLLLCGRENNWLRRSNGALLPTEAPRENFSVTKLGEWGMSLASPKSPFAVHTAGHWTYADAPPPPPDFLPFGTERSFPPQGTNAPVCAWGFYDTSVKGSNSEPQISAAYDDGAAGTPVKIKAAVAAGTTPLEILFNELGADLGTFFVWQGVDAEKLFEQPYRAAYWNGGLRKTIASGFQSADWNGLAVTTLNPRPIVLGGDAQDNLWSAVYPGFVRTCPFAHYSITTPPGTPFLAVRYELGNAVYASYLYSVSFELDGKYMGYDEPWRYGTNIRSIPLPLDGTSHTVDLRNGFTRNNGNYADPTTGSFGGGGFIDAVAVPHGYKIVVNHPVPTSVAIVFSHSVAVGGGADSVPYLAQGPQSSVAWPVQARVVRAFGTTNIVDESYAGELLANDCRSHSHCNAYLADIKVAQPDIRIGFVARMLNDFYHGRTTFGECLPQYEQYLQYFITSWAANFPRVPLYVGSDIRDSVADEAKTDGCTPELHLADWRQGVKNTVDSYVARNNAEWLHFVDMSEWVPQDELLSGGIHPTTEGQVHICQAVAEYFHQSVTCGIPR